MEFDLFIYIVNFIGVVAFAASGVFKGIKHNHDLFGVSVLAIVTAVGGGIMRDVMLNKFPAVLANSHDIYVALITSTLIYIPYLIFKDKLNKILDFKNLKDKSLKSVLICDAIGLSTFIYIGANIAITQNLNTADIIIMATITAVGGGVIRDVLAGETPFVLKEDIYALLCVVGGFLYKYFIIDLKFGSINSVLIIFPLLLAIRLVVIYKKLNLPK